MYVCVADMRLAERVRSQLKIYWLSDGEKKSQLGSRCHTVSYVRLPSEPDGAARSLEVGQTSISRSIPPPDVRCLYLTKPHVAFTFERVNALNVLDHADFDQRGEGFPAGPCSPGFGHDL